MQKSRLILSGLFTGLTLAFVTTASTMSGPGEDILKVAPQNAKVLLENDPGAGELVETRREGAHARAPGLPGVQPGGLSHEVHGN